MYFSLVLQDRQRETLWQPDKKSYKGDADFGWVDIREPTAQV